MATNVSSTHPPSAPLRICFVCLGNICRSTTAEGIFRHLIEQRGLEHAFMIDSAGTGSWHVGHPPDERSVAAAAVHGVTVEGRARRVLPADFHRFDMLIAMDTSNRDDLLVMAPDAASKEKVSLLLDHAPGSEKGLSVPDPYYGSGDGFQEVFQICWAGCEGLLASLALDTNAS